MPTFFSDVSDRDGSVLEGAPDTFTLFVGSISKPATLSLLGLGGLGALGMTILRRRRVR